ncbi:anaerobic ribonucleoside-triphosphate reductase activating protein [Sporosalibacterium faouarense]|uniref:anaerobic ribonucleoside-triphosphate reductase activating protein n=1 Tax=Sporosalibacterium faouarense TaxID=516123 RepID=UPI00141D233E|nr:anaerobic ribonucleoside-triphosphate reductase activating protein [Sporosalibacterium faouarense]MTI47532.1 anaerobic ribonucleoside-triphosphate reductase activating protein [Bacillota bacterium]
MIFKGHQKSSFIDYPDKISTVFFTGGCNFKCPYCHNSSLVRNEGGIVSEKYIFNYLESKGKFLDGVCISGGEPTLQKGIFDFFRKLKETGFLVKLDTNGTRPLVIKKLISEGLVDYIAMDIKSPFEKYSYVTNTDVDIKEIKSSISIIRNSNINYEFRTTLCRELLTKDDVISIAEYLKGSNAYYLQNFKDGETILVGENKLNPFKEEVLNNIEREIKDYFKIFKIRR